MSAQRTQRFVRVQDLAVLVDEDPFESRIGESAKPVVAFAQSLLRLAALAHFASWCGAEFLRSAGTRIRHHDSLPMAVCLAPFAAPLLPVVRYGVTKSGDGGPQERPTIMIANALNGSVEFVHSTTDEEVLQEGYVSR